MNKLKEELTTMLNEKELYRFIYSFYDDPMILIYEMDYNTQEIEIPINTDSNFKIIFENDIEEKTNKQS
jgi:hypothetical protein